MKNLNQLIIGGAILLASTQALSQNRILTSCHIDPQNKINGSNVDKMVPIASVSKLLTAHWAMAKIGPKARMETRFHITQLPNKEADIHIEGSFDPSFNQERLAVILKQLPQLGITKVRSLTFDERFRFKGSVYSGNVVASNPANTTPINGGITPHLRAAVTSFGKMKVGNIDYLNSSSFSKSSSTISYASSSVEVYKILKQMNNNSNNYIANLVFDHLGGPQKYAEFISSRLQYSDQQVKLYNGSGYPFFNSAGTRFDNKASCKAISTIAKDLRAIMSNEGMMFADIVAVAGQDRATLNGAYLNEVTDAALIAKTGTADPVVSLAGIASTKNGLAYFAVVVAGGRPGRASSGRVAIRSEVMKVYKNNGGGQEIAYTPERFSPTDSASLLRPLNQTTLAQH